MLVTAIIPVSLCWVVILPRLSCAHNNVSYCYQNVSDCAVQDPYPVTTDGDVDSFAGIEKYGSCASLGVIAFIGLIGNALCFKFLTSNNLRNKSYSIYFRALSLADSLTLISTGLPVLLEWTFHSAWRDKHGTDICIIFHFVVEFSENLSCMLILAVATDRFIAIVYPLRRRSMCTVKRALWTSSCLFFASTVLAIPDLILMELGLESLDCKVQREGLLDLIEQARFFVISLLLPVIVSVVMSIKVLLVIRKSQKTRINLLDGTKMSGQLRITVALVTVTILSAILFLPVIALEIWAYVYLTVDHNTSEKKDMIVNMLCASELISVINISINYYPLIFIARGYRLSMFRCPRRKQGNHSPTAVSSRPQDFESTSTFLKEGEQVSNCHKSSDMELTASHTWHNVVQELESGYFYM